MIHPPDLLDYVIRPVLRSLEMHSLAAEQLVLGTALTESTVSGNTHLKQLGAGPALGIFQMEPATHNDIHENWLRWKPHILQALGKFMTEQPPLDQLAGNLFYACGMCRIHYRRVPAALPKAGDITALGEYWKQYYNTRLGKGTVEHFVKQTERWLE